MGQSVSQGDKGGDNREHRVVGLWILAVRAFRIPAVRACSCTINMTDRLCRPGRAWLL